jgi:hypothetical protein
MDRREYTEKVFFSAGDIVTLKHDIGDKPKMLIQSVDKTVMPRLNTGGEKKPALLGVTCIWFSTDLVLQSHRFSTKDLEKVKC